MVPNPDANIADQWEMRKKEEVTAKYERLKRREEEEGLDEATVER